MHGTETHAVVLGGSLAGLLAARTLSDHFDRVTIVERDVFSTQVAARKGVPQGGHLHGLLAAGLQALEVMFPDFRGGALARGALEVESGSFGDWYIAGVRSLPVFGMRGLLFSRPALEHYLRELVLARANVETRQGFRARGLIGDAAAVRGVEIEAGGDSQRLMAELVVDCTGRGSRMPSWLHALGVAAAKEDVVRSDVRYASCYVARKPSHLGGADGFVYSPTPPGLRFGAALAVEGGRYIVTLSSYLGECIPNDYVGMIEFARTLPVQALYELLRDVEPVSEVVQMRDPISTRRRYERLRHFPSGLLLLGDSLCNFNPAYGQGMSVAALEARALDACLRERPAQLWKRVFREASRIVESPWAIVVGGDLAFEGVAGARPFGSSALNAYFGRMHRAAAVDPVVAHARLQVMNLLARPSRLFRPEIAWRVLRSGGVSEPRASASAESSAPEQAAAADHPSRATDRLPDRSPQRA